KFPFFYIKSKKLFPPYIYSINFSNCFPYFKEIAQLIDEDYSLIKFSFFRLSHKSNRILLPVIMVTVCKEEGNQQRPWSTLFW
ncbi:MAG TPA: hypothetical protein DDW93_03935, partial [Firmicutes bacterium]|nr:hypothetical protein [Bacillota bacterium]